MVSSRSRAESLVLAELTKTGLILQSDPVLPSVAGIVSGETIPGSWWGHPKGREIFRTLKRLESDPDVLLTRLVSGKVTYLHRNLWPIFTSIIESSAPWQKKGLSRSGRALLRLVEKKGTIRMDHLRGAPSRSRWATAAKEIERRLLVFSDEVHTETGAHAKVLMRWSKCPKLINFESKYNDEASSRAYFVHLISRLNGQYGGQASLPWEEN